MPDTAKKRADTKKRQSRPAAKHAAKPSARKSLPPFSEQGENLIFALDIGTRTVIGVVGERLPDGSFRVLAYEQMEHPGRAMMDGQVEDIAQVGRLILQVRDRLEQRLRIRLSRVSIAAAGRMLHTVRVSAERTFPTRAVADRDAVIGLEGEALELAQEQVRSDGRDQNYYCVGYSIVEYRMDGQPVSQLVGHTCAKISVDLLAAFLPYSVVEGLYAAVDMSGLEVMSLTLEPIAAINVLIPRELRLLNLALVDIGAGTSDIAVCRDGQIASYEMATIAGDEITEAIIHKHLVDFATAEQIKRSLAAGEETLSFENILGMPVQIPAKALQDALQPTIEQLAATIAEKLTACNGGAPSAVFLIGGGSLIPGLGPALAAQLGLAAENIAVGPRKSLKGVDLTGFPMLTGPEFITPIGIAVTAITQECFHFFGVSINGRKLKLLNTSHMRLMDVLLMAGYRAGQIIARSGRSLLFTLNGASRAVRGGIAEPAALTLNGAPASIEADVRPGDVITFSPAADGTPASAVVGDFIPAQGCLSLSVNGQPALPETPIRPGDVVEIVPIPLPEPVLPQAEQLALPVETDVSPAESTVEAPASILPAAESQPTPVTEAPEEVPFSHFDDEMEDAGEAPAFVPPAEPVPQFAPGAAIRITLNGEPISLPLSAEHPSYHIMHLLERAGFDPDKPQGNVRMLCDGAPVGFTHPVENGADVRIEWE